MEKLRKTTDVVRQALATNRATRNGDEILYLEVCEILHPACVYSAFANVMQNRKDFGLPSYESVSRARRKLQAEFPELRADKQTKQARAELEEKYREYARIQKTRKGMIKNEKKSTKTNADS